MALYALVLSLGFFEVALAQDVTTTDSSVEEPEVTDLRNNTVFGDWVVSCQAVTVRRSVCTLVHEQSLRDSGEVLLRMIAAPVEDGAILLAQVPMGVYLPGGAIYRFADRDDQEQREMIWQRCAGAICEAAASLDAEELALFAEESAILFGYRMSPEAEPIILRVSIDQFADAISELSKAVED